jgi:NADPH:quinone reductase
LRLGKRQCSCETIVFGGCASAAMIEGAGMNDPSYRAVVCTELGPPERLALQRLPRAPLTPGTVRVVIKAAGINFSDLLMIEGKYQHRPELPLVPGQEAAGIIAETAPEIDAFAVGQKVIVRMQTGGYAEEAIVPADQILELPAGFSFAEGATFFVAHITAYHALATRAALAPGQKLLVLGAAGGVGLAAVQIGKALGAVVIAAASTAEKLRSAGGCGADHLINYSEERIDEGIKRLTAGAGVEVVFDPVGIAQEVALRCVARDGKLLIVGFAGGSIPAYAGNRILLRGCSVIGVRAGEAGRHNPQMRRQELAALRALAQQGLARPLVSASYPLDRFAEAMQLLRDRRAIGRVALINGD